MIHVDFESAWDGPVVNPDERIKVTIDDLVICRDCVQKAWELLEEASPMGKRLKTMQAERDALKASESALREKLDKVEGVMALG